MIFYFRYLNVPFLQFILKYQEKYLLTEKDIFFVQLL